MIYQDWFDGWGIVFWVFLAFLKFFREAFYSSDGFGAGKGNRA